MSGVGTGIALAAGIGGVGAIAGGALQSSAVSNAAQTQAGASEQAAQLQYQAEQQSLAFQNQVWQQQQQNQAPWLQSGAGALSTMDQLMGLNAPNIPANYGQPGSSSPAPPNPQSGSPVAGKPGNYVPLGNGGYFNTGATTAGGASGPPIGGGGAGNEHVTGSPYMGTMQTPGASEHAMPIPGGATTAGGANGPQVSGPIAVPGGAPVKGTAQQPAGPGSTAPGVSNGQLQPFAPWTQQFQAPTADQARQTPGYQFELDQGTKAVQNSAAARGDLLSGNTLADLTKFGQGLADTTYNDTYNRALGQYQQNYNIYQNNQANQFNRLASMAGMGQTSVNQLNSAGSTAAGQYGSTVMGANTNIGNYLQNAGNATASGYINQGNVLGGMTNQLGQLGSMVPYLNMMNGSGSNPTAGIDLNSAPNSPLTPAELGIG